MTPANKNGPFYRGRLTKQTTYVILGVALIASLLSRKEKAMVWRNIHKSLQEWLNHDLISPQQLSAILDYEQKKPHKNWILISFVLLGVAVVGIGVIAIIAANWYTIPKQLKIFAALFGIVILGYGVYYAQNRQKLLLNDALVLLLLLWILGSIGLIGQIYNTGGELYQALLLWTVITLPLVTLSNYLVSPLLWVTIALFNTAYSITELPYWAFDTRFYIWLSPWLAIPLVATLCAELSRHLSFTQSLGRAFKFWIVWSGLIAVALMDLLLSTGEGSVQRADLPFIATSVNCLLVVVIAVGVGLHQQLNKTQKLLLLIILGLFLFFHALLLCVSNSEILAATMTLLILFSLAFYYGHCNCRKLFVFITLLIAIRILIVYFTVIGSLAYTGIGLIISGIIIIGCAIVWAKNVKRLQRWIEGFLP